MLTVRELIGSFDDISAIGIHDCVSYSLQSIIQTIFLFSRRNQCVQHFFISSTNSQSRVALHDDALASQHFSSGSDCELVVLSIVSCNIFETDVSVIFIHAFSSYQLDRIATDCEDLVVFVHNCRYTKPIFFSLSICLFRTVQDSIITLIHTGCLLNYELSIRVKCLSCSYILSRINRIKVEVLAIVLVRSSFTFLCINYIIDTFSDFSVTTNTRFSCVRLDQGDQVRSIPLSSNCQYFCFSEFANDNFFIGFCNFQSVQTVNIRRFFEFVTYDDIVSTYNLQSFDCSK